MNSGFGVGRTATRMERLPPNAGVFFFVTRPPPEEVDTVQYGTVLLLLYILRAATVRSGIPMYYGTPP